VSTRPGLGRLDKKALRRWLGLFFIALTIPTAVLVQRAYSQLKWETFHRYRVLAEELSARVDAHLAGSIEAMEGQAFSAYSFQVVSSDPSTNFLQRSPLSAYPVAERLPGLIGYFQIDTEGLFSSPLLPPGSTAAGSAQRYGLTVDDLRRRRALAQRMHRILAHNRLVGDTQAELAKRDAADLPSLPSLSNRGKSRPAEREADETSWLQRRTEAKRPGFPSQAGFDRLGELGARQRPPARQQLAESLGRVEDLQLEQRYAPPATSPSASRAALSGRRDKRARKERDALPEAEEALPADRLRQAAPHAADRPEPRIRAFESEIDPFQLSLLDSGHLVLFRKVWRDGQRYIQGALIDREAFLRGGIEATFRAALLSEMSDLAIAYRGEVLTAFSGRTARSYLSRARELRGALLYRARLSEPLSALELIFSITRLPAGPGGAVVTWIALTLALVLCGGFYLMYRLGLRQIALARQQQDFVSAVSHELKTPLTSIRMYSEMLLQGWVDDAKRRTYYDCIHAESERLSRLIGNVLQLSRLTRNHTPAALHPVALGKLLEGLRPRVQSQIEAAGFVLRLQCPAPLARSRVRVNDDYFAQVLINLVDNALKFAAEAQEKTVRIDCRPSRDGRWVSIGVRDYGPGMAKGQLKKVFELFYRVENELTRETAGTGIGLALVQRMVAAMGGRAEAIQRDPGAELRVSLPVLDPVRPAGR
jgi:signal transduction histidine kinase